MQAVRLRRFEPLKPEDEAQEATGWCVIERPFDLEMGHETLYHDQYLLLGFRVDRWRVPASLVNAELVQEEQRLLAKTGREKLTRTQRAELKQRIVSRLRRKVMPATKTIDVCWDIDSGTVLFFSHAARVQADFCALFEKTFGLSLVEDSPFMAADRAELPRALLESLGRVEPVSLVAGRKRLVNAANASVPAKSGAPAQAGKTDAPAQAGQSEDPIERIETTRFLGSELLVWIWARFELLGEDIELPRLGRADVWMDTEIAFQSVLDPGERVTLRGTQPTASGEAKEALRGFKFPTRARVVLRLREGDRERDFAFVLHAHRFAIASGTIPALITDKPDEAFLERMALIGQMTALLDATYASFLSVRLAPEWAEAWEPTLSAWLGETPVPAALLQRLARLKSAPSSGKASRKTRSAR